MAEFDSAIPPGGTGKIVAKVHSRGYRGRVTKSVSVQTNDPARANLSLAISFEVQTPVAVLPGPYANLFAPQGEPAQAEVILRRDDGQPLEVTLDGDPPPGVTVQLEKVAAEKPAAPKPAAEPAADGRRPRAVTPGLPETQPGDWRVKLSAANTNTVRNESGTLKLKTNHPGRLDLLIPVTLRVTQAVQAFPPSLQLQLLGGATTARGRVDFRSLGATPFQVTEAKVEGDIPTATTNVLNQSPSTVQPVEIAVRVEGLTPGVHSAQLVVSTTNPNAPSLKVPITLRVTPAPAARPTASSNAAPGAP